MSLRFSCLGLLATVFCASAVHAQDYFEQKKKEQAIQTQLAIANVTAALESSKDLEKKDPAKAKALLEKALYDLADARGLDNKQYKELNDKLLARLGQVETTLIGQKKANDNEAKAKIDKAVQDDKQRQWTEKQHMQAKAAYDQAKDRIEGGKKLIDAYTSLRQMKEKGVTDATLEIYKSASKMTEERITPYFIAKSELRTKGKLSKDEVALLKALNSKMTPDFDKTPLKDFLEYMETKVPGLTMFLDEASRKELDLDYSTPVTFKTNSKVTVKTILKKVFGDLGLTYVIKEAAIQVITPERTKDYLVTRAYPIQDLITPFDLRMPPYVNQAQMAQQAQQLMLMIVNMIEPQSWAGVGERGYGTIFFEPATKSLIVHHTAEMHYQLGGGLAK
jgi:hypothetical protein